MISFPKGAWRLQIASILLGSETHLALQRNRHLPSRAKVSNEVIPAADSILDIAGPLKKVNKYLEGTNLHFI